MLNTDIKIRVISSSAYVLHRPDCICGLKCNLYLTHGSMINVGRGFPLCKIQPL